MVLDSFARQHHHHHHTIIVVVVVFPGPGVAKGSLQTLEGICGKYRRAAESRHGFGFNRDSTCVWSQQNHQASMVTIKPQRPHSVITDKM
jgi:hypothetical protein